MPSPDLEILRQSDDGVEIKRAALRILRSPQPGDLDAIAGLLDSEEFLLRLDSQATYATTHINLRLMKVVRALGDSDDPDCHAVLVGLTRSGTFTSHPLREKLLIRGLTRLRPLDPGAAAYLRSHSTPESALATDVAEATLFNETEPALEIFGDMVSNEGHPQSLRISWLRRSLLPRRDDLPVVMMTDTLVKQRLTPIMQRKLLEVVYDFQPDRWYKSCRHPEPPNRLLASDQAKQQLVQIADYALESLELPPELTGKIEGAREALAAAS